MSAPKEAGTGVWLREVVEIPAPTGNAKVERIGVAKSRKVRAAGVSDLRYLAALPYTLRSRPVPKS